MASDLATTDALTRFSLRGMEGVNLVAETGFGDWLRKRRGKRSQREVATSAQIGERTVQRYEKDTGPSYELLRLLDALGVRLRPAPPVEAPRALNVEVQLLRRRQEELGAKLDGIAVTLDDLAKFARKHFPEANQEQGNGV